jgi:hypothetical protein
MSLPCGFATESTVVLEVMKPLHLHIDDWGQLRGFTIQICLKFQAGECTHISNSLSESALSQQCQTLIANWMNRCKDNHTLCASDAPQDSEMPTRVLQINDHGQNISIKLIETNGLMEKYVALSHCWGAKEHHPPKTTSTSYETHLAGIPFPRSRKFFRIPSASHKR